MDRSDEPIRPEGGARLLPPRSDGQNISGPYGGVKQTFATVAGDKYKATFWLGSSPQWGIQDGLTVSAADLDLDQQRQNDLWQRETFDFTAKSTRTTLSLLGASGVNYIGLDNVSVTLVTAAAPNATPSVPELPTWATLLVGFAGLGFAGRRAAGKALAA